MLVDSFTVSYSFEAGGFGKKSSNFVSVNFKLPEPTLIEDVEIVRLEASKKVTMWAIQDALMRGEISQEDAKSRLDVVKSNFEIMQTAILKRKAT